MFPALFLFASLVNDVRGLIARNDLASAEAVARSYQARSGATSELAAAMSWLARASLGAGQYDKADRFATETTKLTDQMLRTRKLDADPWLPTAVGAAVEVHGQVLAARGQRAEAVTFLNEQLALYRGTSIGERIRKNINLLSLEGKPAPALEFRSTSGRLRGPFRPFADIPSCFSFGRIGVRTVRRGAHRRVAGQSLRAARTGGRRTDQALRVCCRR